MSTGLAFCPIACQPACICPWLATNKGVIVRSERETELDADGTLDEPAQPAPTRAADYGDANGVGDKPATNGCPIHQLAPGIMCPPGCPDARMKYAIKQRADMTDTPKHPEFAGGGMREAHGDRPRFELLLPEGVPFDEQLLTRFARHMARNAEPHGKYPARNWESFSDKDALERARSAALRHMFQWITGVADGEDHACAIMFNLMCAENIARKLTAAEQARYPMLRVPDGAYGIARG